MVDALDMRGRRGVVSAPESKLPRCGAEEGRAGKGGKGVEGGGLAPRMMRRGLYIPYVNVPCDRVKKRTMHTSGRYQRFRSSCDRRYYSPR